MKKSTTGLLLGSALVVGLSGCASSASSDTSSNADKAWYQHPIACGIAGGLIGGGIGYGTSGDRDEDTGAAVGGTIGTIAGALLCAEPNKEPVQAARVDSDGDGVYDDSDQCPGTPAGVAVDAVGCPLDSDGDGVPDFQDQCPGTPAGVKVNALGCEADLVLRGVHFEFDSATLTPQAERVLLGVAEPLRNNPNAGVVIEGHTDALGSDTYNLELSQARAASVALFLANQGIDPNRMRAIGYGEEQPIATNETEAGRAENRRVELGEWQ